MLHRMLSSVLGSELFASIICPRAFEDRVVFNPSCFDLVDE